MPDRAQIQTDAAPAAIGPYSQAVRAGDLLFCSGQIPLDPQSGELVVGDTPDQARRCLRNLEAVCAAAGSTLASAARVTV
jgi:2-iminobutanoate/2-iminopropanoate deaminase